MATKLEVQHERRSSVAQGMCLHIGNEVRASSSGSDWKRFKRTTQEVNANINIYIAASCDKWRLQIC